MTHTELIYGNLLRILQERTVTENQDGYTFVEKLIPDSDEKGRLDPRVYLVQKGIAEHLKASAGNDQIQFDPDDMFGMAQLMRSNMGWPNQDVTGDAVRAESRVIEGREGSIPIRIYTPADSDLTKEDANRPIIVFFHGGGFIGGTTDVVENPCKSLAHHADAVVFSVDYRLAPEHPFPAGLNDCMDAIRWASEHAAEFKADAKRLAVAGDSAGGNLAAACTLRDRDLGENRIRYQALIYPTVNMGGVETEDFVWSLDAYDIREHREYIVPSIMGLKGGADSPIMKMYLQDRTEPSDPYVAPLLADLTGLPKTLVVTAEYDYLRIEGEAYARKLARAGVETTLIQYNGMEHAFMDKIGMYPQAEDCMLEIAKKIRSLIMV